MKEIVTQAVFSAIDEINSVRLMDGRLEKTSQTRLIPGAGQLDSLGLVELVVAIEQQIEERFGKTIVLEPSGIRLDSDSPFRDVGTLIDHLVTVLETRREED